MDDEPLEPAAPATDLRGYIDLALQGGFPELLGLPHSADGDGSTAMSTSS